MTLRLRHVHNFWDPRARDGQRLQLLPPAPRMIGPQPLYPLPKLQLLPKPAASKSAPAHKPAKCHKRKHGGQLIKRSQRAPGPVKVAAPKPVCILSDTDWCADEPFPLVYGPAMPTHKQWRQMKAAAKQAVRLEAGSVLSAAAKRQEELRQERVAGKIGFYSESAFAMARRQTVGA